MFKTMMAGLLVVMAMTAPTQAQLLDNPQGVLAEVLTEEAESRVAASMASNKETNRQVKKPTPVWALLRGYTVEVEPAEDDIRDSQTFQDLARLYPDVGYRLEREWVATKDRVGSGINTDLAGIGVQCVSDAGWVKRVTGQRQDERNNPEVNQGSMPPTGSIQRPQFKLRWTFSLTGNQVGQEFGFAVMRTKCTLTIEVLTATDLIVVAAASNEVERLTVLRGMSGKEYSFPILPPALDKNIGILAEQLAEAAREGDEYVEANRGRVPFKLVSGYAWCTLGRRDGMVGSNDGTGTVGSQVRVSGPGHSFVATVYATGETTSFLSTVGLGEPDQSLLGQNPTAEVIRDGGSATIPQSTTQPAPTTGVSDVPEIGASPTTRTETATVTRDQTLVELLQESRPGEVLESAASLIRSTYGVVVVGTTDLPDPPEGLKWLRVKNPQAATWDPGTIVLAVLFDDENREVTRFQAIVVSGTGERAITWMPAATSVTGKDWVIGTDEPLPLRVSAAAPGDIITVAVDVQVETEDPLRMRRINIPIGHFGQIKPVRGLIIALRREAVVINAVVVDVVGEKARCAYPLPEQKFDGSWQVVVTPPAAPVEAPAVVEPVKPAPAPRPTMTRPGQERPATRPTKTEPMENVVMRFIAAARQTPVGQRVSAPLPTFEQVGDIGAHRPDGMWMGSPVPVPMAERNKVDLGQVVEITRTVDGERQSIRAVVLGHTPDQDDASKCWVHTWLFEKPEGDGWHLDVPK